MRDIIHGDSLNVLKKYDDDTIDCMLTDPPYGYSFMNKNWDKAIISIDIWKECLRVMKPGAFGFVMSAPRQDVLSKMIVNLGDAGFKIDFTSIYWTYFTGFPKAGNISKLIDKKLGAKSPQAKKLDGSYTGFQPKPAVEVIIVVMKPLCEKSYTEQAMNNGKGITWLDDCKIPTNDKKGRFPANIICSDNSLDSSNYDSNSNDNSKYFDVDMWESQFIITSKPSTAEKEKGLINSELSHTVNDGRKKATDNPYQRGKTVRYNVHPTVKPVSLFKYLITLGSREGDTILDPFVGSGTTGIACEELFRDYIGIEKNLEYYDICKNRLHNYQQQNKMEEYID